MKDIKRFLILAVICIGIFGVFKYYNRPIDAKLEFKQFKSELDRYIQLKNKQKLDIISKDELKEFKKLQKKLDKFYKSKSEAIQKDWKKIRD